MNKIRHVDFRQLKDSFFKGIEDNDTLYQKATLLVLYEHTTPEANKGMCEEELMDKAEDYAINIVFEARAREGVMELSYDKYGTPSKAKLTEKGLKEAAKLISTINKRTEEVKEKRGRGRPKKVVEPVKRGRGRPRKNA